jgi:arsenate reductase
MAEALLREKGAHNYQVVSAGTNPGALHPLGVRVMKEIGIDISNQKTKSVDVVFRQPFDWVITVCDRAREKCPIFPLARWLHWSIQDPEDIETFRLVRDELARRIVAFTDGDYIQDREEADRRPK